MTRAPLARLLCLRLVGDLLTKWTKWNAPPNEAAPPGTVKPQQGTSALAGTSVRTVRTAEDSHAKTLREVFKGPQRRKRPTNAAASAAVAAPVGTLPPPSLPLSSSAGEGGLLEVLSSVCRHALLIQDVHRAFAPPSAWVVEGTLGSPHWAPARSTLLLRFCSSTSSTTVVVDGALGCLEVEEHSTGRRRRLETGAGLEAFCCSMAEGARRM